jgi:hypothetical protein
MGVSVGFSGSRGNSESRSGLVRRARRISTAKQAMKMPARQEETRMVRARTFTEMVAEEIRWDSGVLSVFSQKPSII